MNKKLLSILLPLAFLATATPSLAADAVYITPEVSTVAETVSSSGGNDQQTIAGLYMNRRMFACLGSSGGNCEWKLANTKKYATGDFTVEIAADGSSVTYWAYPLSGALKFSSTIPLDKSKGFGTFYQPVCGGYEQFIVNAGGFLLIRKATSTSCLYDDITLQGLWDGKR